MGVVSLELCQHFPELDFDLENNGSRKAIQNRSTKRKKRIWCSYGQHVIMCGIH